MIQDRIEFYDGDKIVATVESSMIPQIGSKISIRKKTWEVTHVTFALDHADEARERMMRCNVDIKAVVP